MSEFLKKRYAEIIDQAEDLGLVSCAPIGIPEALSIIMIERIERLTEAIMLKNASLYED